MTSVPPRRHGPSLSEPPPWYSGDQPTVPNPIYRDPEPAEGTGGTAKPSGSDSSTAKKPAEGNGAPENRDDIGRRGNRVMGAMLVAGLLVIGAAWSMVSGNEAAGDEPDGPPAESDDEHPDSQVAIAQASDGPGSDSDAAEHSLGAVPNWLDPEATAPFGEAVTVLDGVTVTADAPRQEETAPGTQDPADSAEADVDRLVVEVTAANGTDDDRELLSEVNLVAALDTVVPPDEASGPVGYALLDEAADDRANAWTRTELAPGAVAYGSFGFAVPVEDDADLHLVVWLESGEGEAPVAVAFTGSRQLR